ncbi:nuclear transport factor 2 family protein [Couchioplanes azureus]|uniref:nuclear transport factor 2 family protein n=1 Tax=Couchioplanes caeruleus TaxID=56438 RepID=UPI0016712F80|nr:nuclear transport factor 2 family protein [Couchioplanes caeruleus]GGQ85660.1 hypothetical protein GCM10010166_65020 [Couchioplanes caeruleus subsp. azureus]
MLANTGDITVGERFLAAYAARDWDGLRALLDEAVEWTLPGSARISGTARGADAVIARTKDIAAGAVRTELLHVLVGQSGVTLSLRNTAEHADGRTLDEHLATVLRLRDGRIHAIDTYLSDVPGMNDYFR